MKVLFLNCTESSKSFMGSVLEKNSFKDVQIVECGNEKTRRRVKNEKLDLAVIKVGESEQEMQKISEIRKCKSKIPILAIVGRNNGIGKKCIDHGATDFVYAPVETNIFIEKIKDCFINKNTNKNKKN